MKIKKLLGYYNYTVVLTYIGMLSGFFGILAAMESETETAILCLMLSGFCDLFDGAIASTMVRSKQEKCFGIQIDSLSDLICFGVLPGVLVYSMNRGIWVDACICGLYVLCALIRLAWFNVDEQERQQTSSASRELFLGMPVTMAAVLIPIVYGAASTFHFKAEATLATLLSAMAALFLIPFPVRKPKLLGKICVMFCGFLEVFLMVIALGATS